jgi:hypothetical protein
MNYDGMNYDGMNYDGMNYDGMNYDGMNYDTLRPNFSIGTQERQEHYATNACRY